MWVDAHHGPFMSAEEEGHSRWAWASRTCAHTYYTPLTAQQCARRANRSRILLHGDSQSRALYISMARWLGLPVLSEQEMKRRTNSLKISHHSLSMRFGLTIAQSYTWDMDERILNTSLEAVIRRMRPNVVVINFAASHTISAGDPDAFVRWFRRFVQRLDNPKPSLWVYQRMGALQGMRSSGFREQRFRRYDTKIWEALRPLGFVEYTTRLPELHRFDAKAPDGWHLLMNSTMSMLSANMLFELLCSDVSMRRRHRKGSFSVYQKSLRARIKKL